MHTSFAARVRMVLVSLLAATLLAGCFPGQFPIPPDRSAPPKPAKKATGSNGPYFHGGQAPLINDAVD